MDGVDRMEALIEREAQAALPPSPVRRLAALLPPDAAVADQVGARLKLSNKARKRLVLALGQDGVGERPRALAFRIGTEAAIDRLLLDSARPIDMLDQVIGWTPPKLPISGGTLISRGLTPGPDVAKALRQVEQIWVEENFPDDGRVDQIADQIVSKFQRARQ